MKDLQEQITARRREISTDAYSMSVGELTSLYRDEELDVHPEFQRVYRWSDEQKSKLVESVLLGIPIPSMFVAQTDEGTWDVVDGVQRISTLLELQGLLRDDDGNPLPKLRLKATRYLSELEGKYWDHEDPTQSLTQAQRLDIRRAKVDLKIIKRESTAGAKYDLFQRLNGYGSLLTSQELRSCMVISVSSDFYDWLIDLKKHPSFRETTSLTERLITEQYDLELVIRFLALRDIAVEDIKKTGAIGDFLNDRSIEMAGGGFDLDLEGARFKRTFDLLAATADDNPFRRYNSVKGRFQGAFLNTAFEVFALGLGHHIDYYFDRPDKVDAYDRILSFWNDGAFGAGFATGKSPDERLAKTIPRGREIFAP
ncbi:DUF262 domain-containing protein [Saccharothrix longispora]|uniref:DUF262 domain-containing protein n=1 Tax=Saccharothrix longispora TaxID=33920 RepID=UPI0028FD7B38|nr:DUF262 domain-containing protein [Saccharothrix longispora]MDU0294196.1 DUF262 domain-containing protein [Saccharothrix longispora]